MSFEAAWLARMQEDRGPEQVDDVDLSGPSLGDGEFPSGRQVCFELADPSAYL
ncbi:hypothetical protein [Actinospica robiniae]|uniref:hypothetical protein n=1 Tax=Actinospica robiniae TaxID=304901 RepID=UPI0012F780D6|nr:hypothetical protein [Actinospica robiniae]